ncbi:MAG TPA: ABC transporter substrate-binding protein [Acidimicrobiia bacterium]|nr:ABC transporter substrate-binding protein [Acidimicrobiia bacterium]
MLGKWRRGLGRVVAGLAALTLLPAACSPGGGIKEAAGVRMADGVWRGGEFSVGASEPEHLIPANATTTADGQVLQALFTGLVEYDSHTAEPRNAMAESIQSDDQRHWTIRIKAGWTFHNGEPVTARSFVDAWNFAAYAPNANGNAGYFNKVEGYAALQAEKPNTKEMSGLAVVDEVTFTVRLTDSFSQFPILLGFQAFYPMPQAAYGDTKAFEEAPVGNGPYEMDGRWRHDEAIRLRRFAAYKGTPASADAVEFRIYSKPGGGYEDLLAGNLDVATDVPPDQLGAAQAEFKKGFVERRSSAFYYLGFPLWDKAFVRKELRQAISLAIDREAIVKAIYDKTRAPAHSVINPLVPGSRPDACRFCDYDPARARQLLAAAGGWNGPLQLWFSTSAENQPALEAVANMLRTNLGITDVRFNVYDFSQFLTRVKNRQVNGPFFSSWLMDYPSPHTYIAPLYTGGARTNRTGYASLLVDQHIAEGDRAPSVAAAIPAYQAAEDVILDDMPTIPMWFGKTRAVHGDRVAHVAIDPFSRIRVQDIQVVG